MDRPGPDARLESAMNTSGRAAALLVLVVAALTWVGWTAGIERLTRIYPTWPQMMPWTALWLATLGAAILLQWGSPSRERRWAGRCLAAAAAAFAVLVLAEYASLGSFTVDRIWFGEAVGMREWSWPGRPSVQTALSALPLATAVALIRVDRCTRAVWPLCLAASAAIPFVTAGAYLFDALALVGVSPSKGQAFLTAAALLLLVAATSLARVDRFPLAWLLARPDRSSLVRLLAILAGFPLVVAVVRPIFLQLGPDANAQWTFSILLGTAVVGAVTFYFSQREQHLLIAKSWPASNAPRPRRDIASSRTTPSTSSCTFAAAGSRGSPRPWNPRWAAHCRGGPVRISPAASTPRTATNSKPPCAASRGANRCSNASGCVPSTANTTGSTVMGSPTPMPRATPMG